MEKTVTLAVVGCGRIANIAHFPALTKIANVKIKYACDLIPEKAEKVKTAFGAENAITDYHVALADQDVDAVYVLTPNYAHYQVAMDALRAGKHVFCEKPITVNYQLSCEMAEEANKQNKLLNIGVCNRYQTSVEMLKKMNEEGKFGKIYHVYSSFRAFRSIPGLGGAFTTKASSGGGVLIDWGVHFFDLILYILGDVKIKTVTCDTCSELAKDMCTYKYTSMWAEDTMDLNGTNDVEDMISGYIRTDQASISFNGAWAENIEQEGMYIDFLGDQGGARLTYGGKFVYWTGNDLEKHIPAYNLTNQYEEEDKAFIHAVLTGEKTKTHIDQVLESARLLEKLYQSAAIKREVEL